MIIENATSLNSYLKTLQKNLLDADMEIDMLKIAQCFAGSQGFESETEFVGKLPIMLDSATDSSQRFMDLLTKNGAKGNAPYFSSGILEATARDFQYFPIVARPGCTLKIHINWEFGSISKPIDTRPASGITVDECYGKSKSFLVSAEIYEDEFNALSALLEPLVETVNIGYEDHGEENQPSFSEQAIEAMQTIHEIISEFSFTHNEEKGRLPELALYGEEFISVCDLDNSCITEIHSDKRFLFDHSFSDIGLRQVVAQEILDHGLAINAESLFFVFLRLRDAAVENYIYTQLSVTTEEYKTAVTRLVKVAKSSTGNSKAAAQLLLSFYNGHCWHMSLADVASFDVRNSQAALIVIRGWISIRKCPHSMIDNGEEVFAELVEKWQHLHVRQRYGHLYSSRA